jgi:hypothetical protein
VEAPQVPKAASKTIEPWSLRSVVPPPRCSGQLMKKRVS